ncbi:MucR family transcriptional regulator [Komagataeibacter sp. FXV3]|uniref:MucR family transcriptional regulator n=1 Tax=Komagataeibacter sp. FXV3 TaxID=2608998 RepID=UPI00187B15CD|nr:MucR family transcriptional regulator [Komagataeibacter sp. FXV3]MBE7728578.1 MucR family transcriptional regulator [Komagataeibacter sp. FXV3]
MDNKDLPHTELVSMTTEIVAAHTNHNTVGIEQIPTLIETVYTALKGLGAEKVVEPAPLQPAVPIKKSVFPDYVICLEDGKKLKMLKRHLQTAYGMTPEQYREKWGLPANYPMTAPNYAAHRSSLAQKIGLGRKVVVEPEPEVAAEAPAKPARKTRARRKKGADAQA